MGENDTLQSIAIELNNVAVDLYLADDHALLVELYEDAIKAMKATVQPEERRTTSIDELTTSCVKLISRGKRRLHAISSSVSSDSQRSVIEMYQWSDSESSNVPRYLSRAFKLTNPTKNIEKERRGYFNATAMMFNLGLVYMKVSGTFVAEKIFNMALSLRTVDNDDDHCSNDIVVMALLNNIGCILYRRNKLFEAKNMFVHALSTSEKIKHFESSGIRNSIEEVFNTNIHMGTVYFNLGIINVCLGVHDRTSDALQRSFLIIKDALGSDDPDIAPVAHDIGMTYLEFGKFNEAIDCILEALRVMRICFGNNNADVAKELFHLGQIHELSGDCKEALCIYQETLRLQRATLGTSHPDTILTLCEIGQAYHKICGWDEALPIYKDALVIVKTAHTVRHDLLTLILCRISRIHLESGQVDESVRIFTKAKAAIDLARQKNSSFDPFDFIHLQNLLRHLPTAAAA